MYTAGALAIIGMAGLALDLGLAYLTKTRLQNAVDAAALEGAKSLSDGLSAANASIKALATLELNYDLPNSVTPVFETSATQSPFVAGTTPADFFRATVTGLPSTIFLTKAFGVGDEASIGASAMAGPEPVGGKICGAIPIALCGSNTDPDCADGSCFGITPNAGGEVELKDESTNPGNYGLVELSCGMGANCIKKGMAGGEETCFTEGGTIASQPGEANGGVTGLNARFSENITPSLPSSEYPTDVVTTNLLAPAATIMHDAYLALIANPVSWNKPGGKPKRREVIAPVVDCSSMGPGHSSPATIIGAACLFLTREVEDGGSSPYKFSIFGQLIGECHVESGTPDPDGPGERIVLYATSAES
jgi:hypothetical protein